MKILITIPDEKYHYIKELERGNTDYATTQMLYHAVKYGKPFTRPQGEWTPVSERLPEIEVDVIVTDIETSNTYQACYIGNGYWDCDNGVLKNRIIAWQPLPEPYKKGGD